MKDLRVKAFTILEVTIAMLLTGLAAGITYTVFSIVLKSYHNYGARNDRISAIITLDHVIKRDFELADTILNYDGGVLMRSGQKNVKYVFSPDYILRETGRIDTFRVRSEDLVVSFDRMPLSRLQTDTEMNRLDELRFVVLFEGDTIPCHYLKQYSSTNLIQRNPNAIK